jgi:DNA-binding transcriptional LysR family regulator
MDEGFSGVCEKVNDFAVNFILRATDLPDAEGEALALILMQPPCSYKKAAFDSLAKAERSWNFTLSATSIQGTQSAVAAGLGVSVVPTSAVNKDLKIMNKGFSEWSATSIQTYGNNVDSHPLIEPIIDFLKEELE